MTAAFARGSLASALAVVIAATVAVVALAPSLSLAGGGVQPPSLIAVADLRGSALVFVDPRHPDQARRVPLPGGPHELVLFPDGRVAVSIEQSGQLAIVGRQGDIELLDIGGLPHGLATDGELLFVTDRSAPAVRRLRLQDWSELPALSADLGPHALAATPSGGLVVANANAATIRIGEITVSGPALPETVAMSPDAGRVATAGASDGLVVLFQLDGTVADRILVGGRPVRVLFDASGRQLAVARSAAGSVVLIRLTDGGVDHDLRTIHVGGVPDGLAFDASGSLLFVSDLSTGMVSVIDVSSVRTLSRFDIGESAGAIIVLPG